MEKQSCSEPLLPLLSYSKLITKEQFISRYQRGRTKKPSVWQWFKPSISCSSLLMLFPILKWLPTYSIKDSLIGDLVAGLTVSVLQIPHGLAFAQLARQQPVVGLYMSVFPVIIYTMLGTSPHISLGMQAILVIMVGKIVDEHTAESSGNGPTALEVAMACTLAIGLWQAALACCHLGSLCVFLSTSLVSGLTTAAAVHIIFFQLKHVFGIPLVLINGPLKLIYATISFVNNLPETNFIVFALSLTVMTVLIVFNFYLKPFLAKKSQFPMPLEFILICVSVGISWGLDLKSYNVQVVGKVPSGVPTPIVPTMALLPAVAVDCLVIALINVSINISVVKVFASKGNYDVNENQEVLAYGCSNIFGSFFQSLPVCTALSRSMLLFAVGAKTPLVHLVCLSSVFIMLMFLGVFFEQVPLCVLAAIVIVNVIPLLAQIAHFPTIWRCSKLDGIIWLSTFSMVILIDLDYGIGAGLLVSILIVLYTSTRADVTLLHKIEESFVDENLYVSENEVSNKLCMLQINGCLNFVNSGKLFKNAKIKCQDFLNAKENEKHVVLDLTKVNFIDPTAVTHLTDFAEFINNNSCVLLLTGCADSVFKQLKQCQFFNNFDINFVLLDINQAYNFLNDIDASQ